MSVPGIVDASLDGEEIAARVSLGSDDELFITPTRTIVYRADGLLSDESADEFPHDADRLTLSEGRRKTKFVLEYALDGEREFAVPSSKTDDVLHPVLAGVLNGNGITDPGETVVKTYRFSELTLIITSDRLVKHIGGAVWDGDFEEYHFDDVTNLGFEDGSVATQIVLTVDGRPQRIKAPNEEANDLRERLKRALFEYYDVGSLEEFNRAVGGDGDDDADRDGSMDFGSGVDPLDADPPELEDQDGGAERTAAGEAASTDPLAGGAADSEPDASGSAQSAAAAENGGQSAQSTARAASPADRRDGAEGSNADETESGSVFEPATTEEAAASVESTASRPDDGRQAPAETDPELLERLEALEDAVERQNEIIERQGETIEQLIAELRQGR